MSRWERVNEHKRNDFDTFHMHVERVCATTIPLSIREHCTRSHLLNLLLIWGRCTRLVQMERPTGCVRVCVVFHMQQMCVVWANAFSLEQGLHKIQTGKYPFPEMSEQKSLAPASVRAIKCGIFYCVLLSISFYFSWIYKPLKFQTTD